MKEKIETLYKNRKSFSGYMLTLILKWHDLIQDKNFDPSVMGHNSVLFIDRALGRLAW